MFEGTAARSVRALLGRLKRAAVAPVENRIGPLGARRKHALAVRNLPSVSEAIDGFGRRWPTRPEDPADRPIFILSAGWRSGSTLLQRLLLSGGDALIWGEPYDHCDLVRRLADSLRALSDEYPPDHFFRAISEIAAGDQSDEWVANLYPQPGSLYRAHRSFFSTLYAEPARSAGFSRWGFKEVRLSADYALYLRWLYPDARILLLHRNPYDAYRSYRRFRGWYDRWPDEPILTASQFGQRWCELARGFVDRSAELEALVVRFEDLRASEAALREIADFTGIALRTEVLDRRIAGRGAGQVKPQEPSAAEIRALRRRVEPLAARLGYAP